MAAATRGVTPHQFKNSGIDGRILEGTDGRTEPSQASKRHNALVSLCVLNARSVSNKAVAINDYIRTSDIDILCVTETWITDETPRATINALVPDGYSLLHCSRPDGRRGGGVALMHKSSLRTSMISQTTTRTFSQFEHIECKVFLSDCVLSLVTIYRPPPSAQLGLNSAAFITELTNLIGVLSQTAKEFLLVGDINFHLDEDNECTKAFNDVMDSFNLLQIITQPTHSGGHILDVVICPRESSLLKPSSLKVIDSGICNDQGLIALDHKAIHLELSSNKPERKKKTLTYRPLKRMDKREFTLDLTSKMRTCWDDPPVMDALGQYNAILRSTLDYHAPLLQSTVTERSNTKWYTNDMLICKREKRRLERKKERTKLQVDQDIFNEKCREYHALIEKGKRNFIKNKITECGGDAKKLFRTTNQLIGASVDAVLPDHQSEEELAEDFNQFFVEKIEVIRSSIDVSAVGQQQQRQQYIGSARIQNSMVSH